MNCGGNEGAGQTDAYNFIHHISQLYQSCRHRKDSQDIETCTSAFGRERDKLNVHRELKRKRREGDVREENIRV